MIYNKSSGITISSLPEFSARIEVFPEVPRLEGKLLVEITCFIDNKGVIKIHRMNEL